MRKLEALTKMEYPGRFIILGRDCQDYHNIIIYGLTGRSSSSQARKLVQEDGGIVCVESINESLLKKENRDLLTYNCIEVEEENIAVSNGNQTHDITENLDVSENPVEVLVNSLDKWKYEPDTPNYTPRISGCIITRGNEGEKQKVQKAALSIIKRGEDESIIRQYFEVPLIPGKGKLISTYTGKIKEPLPSFKGEPLDVILEGRTAEEIADVVYKSLSPKVHKEDLRIGVVSLFQVNSEISVHIINSYHYKRKIKQ